MSDEKQTVSLDLFLVLYLGAALGTLIGVAVSLQSIARTLERAHPAVEESK